jgi:hypothetical protein
MANLDINSVGVKKAFFHSLGYTLTNQSNSGVASEKYKSAHNVKSDEIWVDNIEFCFLYDDAVTESQNNDAVEMIGSVVNSTYVNSDLSGIMYPLSGSNYQAWFLDTGTPLGGSTTPFTGFIPSEGWVKPIISPVDVTNNSGAPSLGFQFTMYRPNNSIIPLTNGNWEFDYYAGILLFQPGFRPVDTSTSNGLGFSISLTDVSNAADKLQYFRTNSFKANVFQYAGRYLSDLDFSGDGSEPQYQLGMTTSVATGETGIKLSKTPSKFSRIQVLVNGQPQNIGDGIITLDCHFGSLSVAKNLNILAIQDELIWNSNNAGFSLNPGDLIDIIYES